MPLLAGTILTFPILFMNTSDISLLLPTQESTIIMFAVETLRLLSFTERNTVVVPRYTIPFGNCRDGTKQAQTDVCIIHRPTGLVLLVLIHDIVSERHSVTEAQVVAAALAAFESNNRDRVARGHADLNAMTIPCITMTGTQPTFYFVPVTKELSSAVVCGLYPETTTQVLKCVTVLAHQRYFSIGMHDVEYRKLAFKRFLAFKTLAKPHWKHILED